MRSAETRLMVLDSVDSTRQGVSRTWQSLSVPRKLLRYGLYAGTGVLGAWLTRRLLGGGRVPAPAPAARTPKLRIMAQALTLVALPWLRSRVRGVDWGAVAGRLSPTRIFFRWLGLEK